jgi:methyl-accepting chemotaxis protein
MKGLSLRWKLLIAPLSASICFAVYVAYMAVVLGSSNKNLEAIRDIQYPSLEAATENVAWLDKTVDAFKTAVSTGEAEQLTLAKTLAEKTQKHYSNLKQRDAQHAEELAKLEREFQDYFKQAYSVSEKMVSKSAMPDPADFEKMSTALTTYQTNLNAFRETAHQEFLNTVENTTSSASTARMIGFCIGFFALSLALGLGFLITKQLTGEIGAEPDYVNKVMEEISAGNLLMKFPSQVPPGSLLAAVQSTVLSLREMVKTIRGEADQLNEKANQISASAASLAKGASHGSEAVSSMSAAVEEMSVSVHHISDNAKNTETNSSHSAELASEGEKLTATVRSEVTSMSASIGAAADSIATLVVRANEVGTIAAVIKEIAAQTNLLALNAAIEAAQAGAQGKGFAVVAEEVRHLAERTAQATIQIEKMISSIQNETKQAVSAMETVKPKVANGVRLVEETSNSLRVIREGAVDTLEKVRDVALSTQEQSASSNAISNQVERIAQMIDQTGSSAKHTASIAQELVGTAKNLNQLLGRFKT